MAGDLSRTQRVGDGGIEDPEARVAAAAPPAAESVIAEGGRLRVTPGARIRSANAHLQPKSRSDAESGIAEHIVPIDEEGMAWNPFPLLGWKDQNRNGVYVH